MEPNEENPILKPLYALILALTGGFLIYTYGLNFDNYSETALVNMSYVWVPAISFAITGFINLGNKHSLARALTGAAASFVLLITFFIILWPLL